MPRRLVSVPRKRIHALGPILALVMLVVFGLLGLARGGSGEGVYVLQILKWPEKKLLLERSVQVGDRFYLDYIHSSDHTPIHDVFRIEEQGRIVLLKEVFDWYGAGLAFHPRAEASIRLTGEKTSVRMHRRCDPFNLRVGRVAQHALTVREERIPLKEIAAGGDLLRIRVVGKGDKAP